MDEMVIEIYKSRVKNSEGVTSFLHQRQIAVKTFV